MKTLLRKAIYRLNIFFNKKLYYSIIHLVNPIAAPFDLKRFGREEDGGYLLPVSGSFDYNKYAVLSFGVADDISFEESLKYEYPDVTIHCFDPFISNFPKTKFSNIHFYKKGISGIRNASKGLFTLDQICQGMGIKPAQKILMKMDIEGWEWGVFADKESTDKYNVEVIALELHFIILRNIWDALFFPFVFYKRYQTLRKLLLKYHVVHLHANNVSYTRLKDVMFPDLLELTLVKKNIILDYYFKNEIVKSSPPNKIDKPNYQVPFQL